MAQQTNTTENKFDSIVLSSGPHAGMTLAAGVEKTRQDTFRRAADALGVVALTESEKQFVEQAASTLMFEAQAKVTYMDLCAMFRERCCKRPAKDVKDCRKMLLAVGYHKVTVSELEKVALSPDVLWKQYQSKTIGFRMALDAARKAGDRQSLAPDERIKASAMAFVHRLFSTGAKELTTESEKKISVGDYEITVVKKAHKPNPINTGKKGKKK